MTNPTQTPDPRHERRVLLAQALYSRSFAGDQQLMEIPSHLIEELQTIEIHLSDIDSAIKTHAPKYPLDQVAKADLAILRLAVY
jgi:transcription termination factor NusB